MLPDRCTSSEHSKGQARSRRCLPSAAKPNLVQPASDGMAFAKLVVFRVLVRVSAPTERDYSVTARIARPLILTPWTRYAGSRRRTGLL